MISIGRCCNTEHGMDRLQQRIYMLREIEAQERQAKSWRGQHGSNNRNSDEALNSICSRSGRVAAGDTKPHGGGAGAVC
jgi:hypothetical protein